jgi:hypothetical protein
VKVLVSGLLGFLLLGAPAPAWASQASLASSTQAPPEQASEISLPRTTSPIITDNAIIQSFQTWSMQITSTLSFVGGDFSPNWQRRPVGANQATKKKQVEVAGDYRSLQVPVRLYYGLTPRLDVSVTVPFIQNWVSNMGPASRAAHFGSIGDSSLNLRYMFLNGKPTAPTVTGYFSVLFPTGHATNLEPKLQSIDQTGSGAFAFTWGIDFFTSLSQGPILFYANVWYTNFADGWVNGARVYYPDQVTVNLAIEVPLKNSPNNRWTFLLEMLSSWDAGRMFGPKANQAPSAIVSVLPALEFLPTSWFNVALGVQVDLIGKNTQYTYSPILACFINF